MSGRPPDAVSLRDILDELRLIRQASERPTSSSLTRADRDGLAKLLPAIVGVLGSELSLVRDLFESDKPALRLVLRGLNARQVGRLLRRAEGHMIGGHVIQRDGEELGAVLWRVMQSL